MGQFYSLRFAPEFSRANQKLLEGLMGGSNSKSSVTKHGYPARVRDQLLRLQLRTFFMALAPSGFLAICPGACTTSCSDNKRELSSS
jgi:hypothetical protein